LTGLGEYKSQEEYILKVNQKQTRTDPETEAFKAVAHCPYFIKVSTILLKKKIPTKFMPFLNQREFSTRRQNSGFL
jgi:hypothetical protein